MKDKTAATIIERVNEINSLNPKSGLTYALQHFCHVSKMGIGLSRREITEETQELSPFVHSWSTFHRYAGVAKAFVKFCRIKKIKKLHKVQKEMVEEFFLEKIRHGRRESTIETNMCALQKFFAVCGRSDLADFIADHYSIFKEKAKAGSAIHAFDNPDLLIDKLARKHELSAVIAELILLTGARIHEVRSMCIEGTNIIINKGKGGKKRALDFSYRKDHLEHVKTLQTKLNDLSQDVKWQRYAQKPQGAYQSHVKSVCREIEDEYQGAHGLRANYAQNLRKLLEEKGLDTEEIELTITRELGHERRSMARHYLSV